MGDRKSTPSFSGLLLCAAAFVIGFVWGGVRIAELHGEGLLDLTPKAIANGLTSWQAVVAWVSEALGVSALDLANGVSALAVMLAALIFRGFCARVLTDQESATRTVFVLCTCSLVVHEGAASSSISLHLLAAALAVRGLISDPRSPENGASAPNLPLAILAVALAAWTGGLAATVLAIGLARLGVRRDSSETMRSPSSNRVFGALSVLAMLVASFAVSGFDSVFGELWSHWLRPLFPLSLVGLVFVVIGRTSGWPIAVLPMWFLAFDHGSVEDRAGLASALLVWSVPVAVELGRQPAARWRQIVLFAGVIVGLARFIATDEQAERVALDRAVHRWLGSDATTVVYVADEEERAWWRTVEPAIATVLVLEAAELCDSILLNPEYAASLELLLQAELTRRSAGSGRAFLTQSAESLLREREQRHRSPGAVRLLDHFLDSYKSEWVSDGPLRGREMRLK